MLKIAEAYIGIATAGVILLVSVPVAYILCHKRSTNLKMKIGSSPISPQSPENTGTSKFYSSLALQTQIVNSQELESRRVPTKINAFHTRKQAVKNTRYAFNNISNHTPNQENQPQSMLNLDDIVDPDRLKIEVKDKKRGSIILQSHQADPTSAQSPDTAAVDIQSPGDEEKAMI